MLASANSAHSALLQGSLADRCTCTRACRSAAVVQASHWTQDVSQLRQWLDDVQFSGGGGQPVTLGEALLEAAALLELPSTLSIAPGAPALQAHCLVCMVSDPSAAAVPWPYPSVYGKVRVLI